MLMNMFSSRYRSLKDEEDVVHGKSSLYACCDSIAPSRPPFSSGPLPPSTTIAPLPPPSSSPKSSSSSSSSAASSTSPSFALQSLRAAWRSLSSLGFSSPRLPHLERAASTPDSSGVPHHTGAAAPQLDSRYTQFPIGGVAAPGGKRTPPTKESVPQSRAHCLRWRRANSKSDNALHRVGVRVRSRSDHNIHRVCLVGGSNQLPPPANAIFSNVHLSPWDPPAPARHLCHRSRSLERSHRTRLQQPSPTSPLYPLPHTRSLERNHKFRLHLPGADAPPDHPAPPPPGGARKDPRRHPHPTTTPPDAGTLLSTAGSSSGVIGSGASATGMEVGQGGSFINKPPRGWLHPDQQLADEGICYGVRYIGALEVNTSMKSLNFDTRSLIAKECISKVCEAAGLKTADRKRKVVKSIGRIIGERPLMEHAGSNVTLTITSSSLTLTTLEAGQVVASHDMPNISFASGGDPDTLDFIAYVARDNRYGRACFVLECGGGLAQDVITTIGQAFELRFKEYLKRAPATVQYTNLRSSSENASSVNGESTGTAWSNKYDREYYNDLPGKVPPDLPPPPVPPLPQYSASNRVPSSMSPPPGTALSHPNNLSSESTASAPNTSHSKPLAMSSVASNNFSLTQVKGNDNLIDLSCDGVNPLKAPPAPGLPSVKMEPEYVNDAIIKQNQGPPPPEQKDPFDMQPFTMQLTQMGGAISTATAQTSLATMVPKALPLSQRLELQREIWYHGPISRKEAEMLLKQDGDFLVRESQATTGQYVLTGIQNGIKKHLLLVNPEGVVRTKSRTFDSVSHLINYHRDNELPIVSAESALCLRNPVPRAHL